MRGPQNSCRTLPQPKNSPLGNPNSKNSPLRPQEVKNEPKIKSKSNARIEKKPKKMIVVQLHE